MKKNLHTAIDLELAGVSLAAGFWAWLAYHQVTAALSTRNPVPLLLGVESGLVGGFLLARRPESSPNPHPGWVRALVLASTVLGPLLVNVHNPPNLAVIAASSVGLALTLWALITLGRSFGVAPADRGLVTGGPYRFLRHPMYAGALLNLLAVVTANLSLANGLILLLAAGIDIWRICLEERTVQGYADYARQVRWRLVPGVW